MMFCFYFNSMWSLLELWHLTAISFGPAHLRKMTGLAKRRQRKVTRRWYIISLKSKATLTNKIMICLLWWLLFFIKMMRDPLWWQKERCEGTVIGQMLARVDGGGAIEHRWQWSIRATDASGKGVAGILPRICLFLHVFVRVHDRLQERKFCGTLGIKGAIFYLKHQIHWKPLVPNRSIQWQCLFENQNDWNGQWPCFTGSVCTDRKEAFWPGWTGAIEKGEHFIGCGELLLQKDYRTVC